MWNEYELIKLTTVIIWCGKTLLNARRLFVRRGVMCVITNPADELNLQSGERETPPTGHTRTGIPVKRENL